MTDELARIIAEFAENPRDAVSFDAAVEACVRRADATRLLSTLELRAAHVDPRLSAGHWRRGVDALERLLAGVSEPGARARVLAACAKVWEEKLRRPDQALLQFQAASRVDRTYDDAFTNIRRIQADDGNWLMVGRTYQRQLQIDRSPQERAALLIEAANVHRRRLDDAKTADRLLEEARSLDPEAVRAAGDGARERRSWKSRLERAEAGLYGTRGADRAQTLIEIADIWIDESGEPVNATPYVEEAVRLTPDADGAMWAQARLALAIDDPGTAEQALRAMAEKASTAEARGRAMATLGHLLRDHEERHQEAEIWIENAFEEASRSDRVLDIVRDFYTAREDWYALASALERSLDGRVRPGLATAKHMEIGTIYWQRLGEMDRAERSFRRVRLADARDTTMLRFYVAYHTDAGDWPRALTSLRALRDVTSGEDARLDITERMATVALERLRLADRAVDMWTAARAEYPDSERVRTQLSELLASTGKWNRLLEIYKEELSALGPHETAARVGLLMRIAGVYRDHFDLPVLEGNAYASVLEVDPGNVDAGAALAERYDKAGRFNDLTAILRLQVGSLPLQAQVETWKRIGAIERDKSQNPRAAARAFERALELSPEDPECFAALKALYAHSPEDLFRVRQAELEWLPESAQVDALQVLLASSGASEVTASERIGLLRRWVNVSNRSDEATRALEEELRGQGAWADYVTMVEQRLSLAPSDDVESLRELARVRRAHVPDAEREQALWRRVLELEPGDEEAVRALSSALIRGHSWDELEVLAGELDDWDVVIKPLKRAAEHEGDSRLFTRLARVLAERLDDRAGQIAMLERAMTLNPSDTVAGRALETAYGLVGNPTGRARVLATLIESAPEDEHRDLRMSLAALLLDDLNRPADAFSALEPVFESSPSDSAARDRLSRAAVAAGLTGAWMARLKREAARMPASAARRGMYYGIANVAEEHANAPLEAADYLERVRAEAPTPELSRRLIKIYERTQSWQRLLPVVEAALDSGVEGDERDDLLYQAAFLVGWLDEDASPIGVLEARDVRPDDHARLRRLRERLETAERWHAVVEVAAAEGDVARGSGEKRAAKLAEARALHAMEAQRAGEALRALIDDGAATEEALAAAHLLMTLHTDETDANHEAAVRAYTAHGEWSDVVTVLERRGEHGEARDATLRELARIHVEELKQPSRALDALLSLRAPTDADLALTEQSARASSRLPDAVDTWSARDDAASLRAAARVLEFELDRLDAAQAMWRRAFEADPANTDAVAALERLNRSLMDGAALADHLVASIDSVPTRDRGARLREAGALIADTEGRAEDAVALFQRALEADPRDLKAYDGLEALYGKAGSVDPLVALLRQKVEVFADRAAVRAAAFRKLGDAILAHTTNPTAAIDAYRQSLDVAPTDRATLGAVAALSVQTNRLDVPRRNELAAWVTKGLIQLQDTDGLLDYIERRIGVEPRETAVPLHREAALLAERESEDPARAFHHWSTVVALDFADLEAVNRYVALGRKIGAHAELVSGLEGLLHRDVGPRSLIRDRLVDIYLHLNEREEAIQHLEAAVREDGKDLSVLRRLEALYRETGASRDLAEILLQRSRGLDRAASVNALQEAAQIFGEVVGDPGREADCLTRLARLQPEDISLLRRLERLLERLERWEELTSVLAALAKRSDGANTADLRLRRALVLDKALDDLTRAVAAYRSVLELRADDRVALERLEVLYERIGMAAEQAEVLKLRIPTLRGEAQTDARIRLAALQIGPLEDVEAGLEGVRGLLEDDPSNAEALALVHTLTQGDEAQPDAIALLVSIYRNADDTAAAVDVLKSAAPIAPRARRLALWREAIDLQLSMDDRAGAFASSLEALKLSRGEPEAVDSARTLAEDESARASLAEALTVAAEDAADPARRVELLLGAGDTLWNELSQPKEAESAYRRVLEDDPMNVDALRALDEIYAEVGAPESRAQVVDSLAYATADQNVRLHLLHRSAMLHGDEVDDLEAAIERYEQILRVDAGDATALARLRTLLRRQQAWARLEFHLERMIEHQHEPLGRVPLLLELATLRTGERGTPQLAVAPLVEAITLDPSNMQAVRTGETVVNEVGHGRAAAPLLRALAERYRSYAQWDQLDATLQRLASVVKPDDAARCWSELASIREEQLGDVDGALQALTNFVRSAPWDTAAVDRMERLAESDWRWVEVADALREIADGRDIARAERTALLERVARISDEWIGDTARAIEAYEALFDTAPDARGYLDALVRLNSRAGDWVSVARLLRAGAADEADPEVAGALFRRAAEVSEGLAGRPHDAVDVLTHALSLDDPEVERTRVALAAVLGREGAWESQSAQLQVLAEEGTTASLRDDARLQWAWLRWQRLGDADTAITLAEPLLAGARRAGEAFELLAAVLNANATRELPSPAALRAADLLEPAASQRGRDDVLIGVYGVRARVASAPRAAAAALVSIAEVHARSGRGGRLELLALREALSLLPSDQEIADRIRKVARRIGDRTLVRRTFVSAAGTSLEDDGCVALMQQAARSAEDNEGDIPLAAELHQRVLAARPRDRVSTAELGRLSAITGDHAALTTLLRERLAAAHSPDERVEALQRLASVVEDDDPDTVDVLEALVRAGAADDEVVERLDRLARLGGDDDRLCVALEAQARAGSRSAVEELATLRSVGFGDVDGAIAAWTEYRETHGDSLHALRELANLYRGAARWRELVEVLERINQVSTDPVERTAVQAETANIRGWHLDDAIGSLNAYVALLSEDPNDTVARQGLESLLSRPDTAAGAARALEPSAAAAGDHERRLELLDIVLAHSDTPDHQVELALRMADVAARELGDLERAFEFASIAIRLQPTNAVVLHRMRSYAEGMEELERLALQLEDAAETAENPNDVAWLSRLAGDLWRGPLKSESRAIDAYRRAAEARPDDPDAAQLLERALRNADRIDELREALGERAKRVFGREQVDVYCRLAVLAEEQGEFAIAVDAYLNALSVDARAEDALDGLRRLASAPDASDTWRDACVEALDNAGRVEALREFLALCAGRTTAPNAARYHARIGNLAVDAGQSTDAAEAFLAALEADPLSREAFAGAARVIASPGHVERLVAVVETSVGQIRDPEQQFTRLFAAGQLLADRGASPDAIRMLRDAVAAQPDSAEAVDALEMVLVDEGRFEDALAALEEFASLASSRAIGQRHLRRRIELAREASLPPSRIVGMLVDAVRAGVVDERTLRALVALSDDVTWRGSATALREQLPHLSSPDVARVEAALAELSAPPRRDPDAAISYWRGRLSTDPKAYSRLLSTLETAERWQSLVHVLTGDAGGHKPTPDDLRRAARVQRVHLKDAEAAARTYREVLRLDPTDQDAREAFEVQMLELGRVDDVVALLREELAAEDEGALERHLRIAELVASQGDHARAASHIEAALALDSTAPRAISALVDVYLFEGRAREAEQRLRSLLSSPLDAARRVAMLGLLADVLERTARDDAALQVLQDALALDPLHPETLRKTIARLTNLGDWQTLQRVRFNAASAAEPDAAGQHWDAIVKLAVEQLKDHELGLTAALEALAVGRASTRAVTLVREAIEQKRLLDEIEDALANGTARQEERDGRDAFARLFYLQSRVARAKGDHTRALESLKASFLLAPEFLPTALDMAEQHVGAQRWNDALAILQPLVPSARADGHVGDTAAFFAILGLAEQKTGSLLNARAAYSEALESDPMSSPALEGLRTLGRNVED